MFAQLVMCLELKHLDVMNVSMDSDEVQRAVHEAVSQEVELCRLRAKCRWRRRLTWVLSICSAIGWLLAVIWWTQDASVRGKDVPEREMQVLEAYHADLAQMRMLLKVYLDSSRPSIELSGILNWRKGRASAHRPLAECEADFRTAKLESLTGKYRVFLSNSPVKGGDGARRFGRKLTVFRRVAGAPCEFVWERSVFGGDVRIEVSHALVHVWCDDGPESVFPLNAPCQ